MEHTTHTLGNGHYYSLGHLKMPFQDLHSLTCLYCLSFHSVWHMVDNAEIIILHKVARLEARTLLIL